MKNDNRELGLQVWYQDKKARFACEASDPLIIGRNFLQQLFGVNGDSFRNVSRRHLEITYDERNDQFWCRDRSLLGSLVRVVGEAPDDLGPEFLYHHDQFLIKRRMRIRLQNEDVGREPDDVIIEINNHTHDETKPILDSPAYWDRLLKQLHSIRAVQLVGLPGTGKSTLAKKLLASEGTMWQRQRDRELGGTALVAWVDCHIMDQVDERLWMHLARRILTALLTAVDDLGLTETRDELRSAIKYFDANVSRRIGQMNPVFRQAWRAIAKSGLRPLIIFDHFDTLYARLDKFMVYQLYQFHQWPEIGEMLRYVVITRRSLAELRNDSKEDGVVEFTNLFARYAIQMTPVRQDEFRPLWSLIAPTHQRVEPAVLDHLYHLSGGHPGLMRELYEELAINGWLDAPDQWQANLASVDWQERPPQSCVAVWNCLTGKEQEAVVCLLDGGWVSAETKRCLQNKGILNAKGEFFSPLFRDLVAWQQHQIEDEQRGLRIDTTQQRVFVDGSDVTPKLQGRKLDVLLYMHQNANQLCDYESLIKHTLPDGTVIDTTYVESERGALQRTVSRLCRIIDPNRQHIQNEQGRGYIFRYSV